MNEEYSVIVTSGKGYILSFLSFKDERKARDHYTDMLVKYPDYKVELIPKVK